jgi:hypothetical protein
VFKLVNTGGGFLCGDVSDVLEWHDVDAVLQDSTFSHLRNVYFLSDRPFSVLDWTLDEPQPSPTRANVLQRLPLCHARGIFRVGQSQ